MVSRCFIARRTHLLQGTSRKLLALPQHFPNICKPQEFPKKKIPHFVTVARRGVSSSSSRNTLRGSAVKEIAHRRRRAVRSNASVTTTTVMPVLRVKMRNSFAGYVLLVVCVKIAIAQFGGPQTVSTRHQEDGSAAG